MSYPEFVENTKYFLIDSSKTEAQQLMGLANNLKKIHQVTTKNFDDFDQLIHEYLLIGLEIFELKVGIVSKIHADEYVICDTISEDGAIKKGDVFSVEGTYCREVVKSNSVIGFPHVGNMPDMRDHPVYVNMNLESYISAPISVHGHLFGTFNFSSTEPRKHGFSEHERDLISMMAKSIGSFLELKQKEDQLKASNERMKNLVGYVAHDLRGNLGTISALSSYLDINEWEKAETIIDHISSYSEKGLEMVHTILETAAMGTGKIQARMTETDFSEQILKTCKHYQELSLKKSLKWSITCPQNFILELDRNRMDQVLENLLSNAVKFSPQNGLISVLAREAGDRFEVVIKNSMDKPEFGTPEFNINESVGFGQQIAREILQMHKSELVTNEDDGDYVVKFSLKT